MLDAYREHVAERAAQNIPPAPLSPEQVAGLVELIQAPPAGDNEDRKSDKVGQQKLKCLSQQE